MVVVDFEVEHDFFQVNPHLRLPFKNIIDSWESTTIEVPKKAKKSSIVNTLAIGDSNKPTLSQVMWAIALYVDYDSAYFNYPDSDRLEVALEQSGCPKKYELSLDLIKSYDKLQEDSEKRYFRTWCDKVDEANVLLKETKMTMDNMEDIMKAMEKLEKLLKQKDQITDRINKKKKDNVRGDKELGGLESGLFD